MIPEEVKFADLTRGYIVDLIEDIAYGIEMYCDESASSSCEIEVKEDPNSDEGGLLTIEVSAYADERCRCSVNIEVEYTNDCNDPSLSALDDIDIGALERRLADDIGQSLRDGIDDSDYLMSLPFWR